MTDRRKKAQGIAHDFVNSKARITTNLFLIINELKEESPNMNELKELSEKGYKETNNLTFLFDELYKLFPDD